MLFIIFTSFAGEYLGGELEGKDAYNHFQFANARWTLPSSPPSKDRHPAAIFRNLICPIIEVQYGFFFPIIASGKFIVLLFYKEKTDL
jgi:hypothetical protein